MSEIIILQQLKKQLITFFDELIDSFPEEKDFVVIRVFVDTRLPITEIMDYIVKNLVPLKDLVEEKNDKFFLDNNILFEKVNDKSKVNYFKKLWQSPDVDKENKDVIWRWFKSFISLAKIYIEIKEKQK